jgi:hypothetical protein
MANASSAAPQPPFSVAGFVTAAQMLAEAWLPQEQVSSHSFAAAAAAYPLALAVSACMAALCCAEVSGSRPVSAEAAACCRCRALMFDTWCHHPHPLLLLPPCPSPITHRPCQHATRDGTLSCEQRRWQPSGRCSLPGGAANACRCRPSNGVPTL